MLFKAKQFIHKIKKLFMNLRELSRLIELISNSDMNEINAKLKALDEINIKLENIPLSLFNFENLILLDQAIHKLLSLEHLAEPNHPNTTLTGEQLKDLNIMKVNIKTLAYHLHMLKEDLASKLIIRPETYTCEGNKLISKVCTFQDFTSPWYKRWSNELFFAHSFNRKVWEFCYIMEVLFQNDLLKDGILGMGFGCGNEPLPSLMAHYGVKILATDAPPEVIAGQGWTETNQHAFNLGSLHFEQICSSDEFSKNVMFEYVDMNNISHKYDNQFDFVWSSCALEHLGSLQNGLDFILNSLSTLKSGGIAIHTTEFDISNSSKIDNWITVLYTKDILMNFTNVLKDDPQYELIPISFDKGNEFQDDYIDIPPYSYHQSIYKEFMSNDLQIKLSVDGYPCTSIGLIIKKH